MNNGEWRRYKEVLKERTIYGDPFMQEVRDKCDTLEAVREAMGSLLPAFKDLYLDIERNISGRRDTSDMFFMSQRGYGGPNDESFYIRVSLDCRGDFIGAWTDIRES